MDCGPPHSSVHRDSPGKDTRVGCHALLPGIFPTQASIQSLPHCRWILNRLRHQGSWFKYRVNFRCPAEWFRYMYMFFFRFISLIDYCKVLSVIPGAIQYILVGYVTLSLWSVTKLWLTLCISIDCNPQAPLSIRFPRQDYWSGLPFFLPEIFSTQGSKSQTRIPYVGRWILYHWVTRVLCTVVSKC